MIQCAVTLTVACLATSALAAQSGGASSVVPGRALPYVFPGSTWATTSPESVGIDGASLRAGITALGAPANRGPILVVANGQVIHTVGDPSPPVASFSVSKGVTALVVAHAIRTGRIGSIDDLVPNTHPGAWSTYPGDASYRQFLAMTAEYGMPSPRRPGLRYAYNNYSIDFLGRQIARSHYGVASGAMDAVAQQALFAVVGRQDALSFAGQWSGYGDGLRVSPRDLARLGILLARQGVWHAQQLLDPATVEAIFRNQVDPRAVRFPGFWPNERSNWNNQSATDRMFGNFSLSAWRCGDVRASGAFRCIVLEGFRGKRVLVCPRGSLANPDLEVVLVAMPQLPDEGPSSSAYLDVIKTAVIPPSHHPDHDARCVFVAFDDGAFDPLVPRAASASIQGGEAVFQSPTALDLPSARLQDVIATLDVAPRLPAGAAIGFAMRLERPGAPVFGNVGTYVFAGVERRSDGRLGGLVVHPSNAGLVWRSGPPLTTAVPDREQRLRVELIGSRLDLWIGDEAAFVGGVTAIPQPVGGGFMAVVSREHLSAVRFDNVLWRPLDGPFVQVAVDRAGRHYLAFLATRALREFDLRDFGIEYDDLDFTTALLPNLLPYTWPSLVSIGRGHLVLGSTATAPIQLLGGRSLAARLSGRREGEFLR